MEDCVSLYETNFEKFKKNQDQRVESPTLIQKQYSEEKKQIQKEQKKNNFDHSQLKDIFEEEKSSLQTIQLFSKIPAIKLIIIQNSKKIISVPLSVSVKFTRKKPHNTTIKILLIN